MVSNLYDYDGEFKKDDLLFLDRVILSKAHRLQEDIRENFNNYNFHLVISKILNFCVNDLGGMYLDVIKDRLYTMKSDSLGRRSAQYAVNHILNILIKSISPILPFTAYEFQESLKPGKGDDIFYTEFQNDDLAASSEDIEKFEFLDSLRSRVYQAIETERQKGNIKNALDCELEIALKKEHFALLEPMQNELHKFFISSSCVLKAGDEEVIVVKKSEYEKCSRCWHRCEDLNEDKICTRCETNMFGEGEIRGFF
tara:strand:- start:729 stop:1493 length:765 start_codon:yes stop_codon:yes gene_type:complete